MSGDTETRSGIGATLAEEPIALPGPTSAPMVLSLGLALLAAGAIAGLGLVVIGLLVFIAGLGLWISELLPGRGHVHVARVAPALRPSPVQVVRGAVARLETGMPGYRIRLPTEVHPISAGLKGGIVGGLVMPLPAFAYGLLSGHGIWYPVNLLAGMGLPGVDRMSVAELEQFRPMLTAVAVVIHVVTSVIIGLAYGVLLPTLPTIPKALAWAGLLMPLLWTGVSFGLLRVVNPLLDHGIDWPWFILSQFVYGVVTAGVVMGNTRFRPVVAGLLGGLLGGLLMPLPAILWGIASGNGPWYPINLLAAMVSRSVGSASPESLRQFHPEWILMSSVIHAAFSASFGLLLGLTLPILRPISAAMAWGGMLMPMLWTSVAYGLMGVLNPPLQQKVDWPWFIVSQFVYGLAAALVVNRSEKIYIPPAGTGPERLSEYLEGPGEVAP